MNKNRKSRLLSRGLLCAGFVVVAPAVLADTPPALDRVSVWLGGYFTTTNVSLNASAQDGAVDTGDLHLENGHQTVARARVDFLILDSQGFTLDYYSFHHSSAQTITDLFSYEGVPFELDTTVQGKLDLAAASASYHWWFGSSSDVFGLGLGATCYRVKLGLAGTGAVGDEDVATGASWSADAIAPLLTLGFKHAFSDSLRIYANASGVRKNGGTLAGHIYDARVGVEWFPWHNLGLGAEYGATRIRLDRESRSYDAKLDINLDGPSLFARLRF